jgi:membrane protease YdiL (CAAX protease family)
MTDNAMNGASVGSPPAPLGLRILRFPLIYAGLLYLVLSYVYLAGFFFRGGFAPTPVPGIIATLFSGAVMVIVYAWLANRVEQRPASEVAPRPMLRELAIGILLGAGLYALCIAILMVLGVYRIEGFNPWPILLPGLAVTIATGVFEELVFRGGVFCLAEEWLGTWWAIVVSSIVFGFVHLENPEDLRGVLSITLWAGMLLAATYVLTRRLWLGIGLHAAWNYVQGSVFSGIVSGHGQQQGFTRSSMSGPEWLTGGSFGVEASVVAMAVCIPASAAMMVMAARRGHIMAPRWKRVANGGEAAV